MSIDATTVRRIAHLARVAVADDEVEHLRGEINAMLEMGRSKPWPDALESFTGERDLDASAILDYFAPLDRWLTEQNKDETCGW